MYEELEKLNFLYWYRISTKDEINSAIKKYGDKIKRLMNKYKKEIDLENIVKGKLIQ